MEELKDLTTMQLTNMIQELSTKAPEATNSFDGVRIRRELLEQISEVADVLMNKLKVQAFKSVMGAE